jgi:hypothetical protein
MDSSSSALESGRLRRSTFHRAWTKVRPSIDPSDLNFMIYTTRELTSPPACGS